MDKILFIGGQRILEHLENLIYKQEKRALEKMIMVQNFCFGANMIELPKAPKELEIEFSCCSQTMKNQVPTSSY